MRPPSPSFVDVGRASRVKRAHAPRWTWGSMAPATARTQNGQRLPSGWRATDGGWRVTCRWRTIRAVPKSGASGNHIRTFVRGLRDRPDGANVIIGAVRALCENGPKSSCVKSRDPSPPPPPPPAPGPGYVKVQEQVMSRSRVANSLWAFAVVLPLCCVPVCGRSCQRG